MTQRKIRVKRKVSKDLKRTSSPQELKEIVEELAKEAEKIPDTPPARQPGLTVHGGKVPYTHKDLCKMFPIVNWTPEENVPLTFQGVTVWALSGIEMYQPKCFKDIYDKHRKGRREREELPPDIKIESGAGMLG